MCGPTTTLPMQQHVVIAGAGPAGLLLANLLLKRNDDLGFMKYKVTLVESHTDIGTLSVAELRQNHRSWMLALAGHGLEALRTIPELYKDYVQQPHVGVRLEGISIFLGSKELNGGSAMDEGQDNEGYTVDRNFVVAAMAKYMTDTYGNNPALTCRYETKLQYVDAAKHRVLVRSAKDNDKEEYITYDLLVGADGSRSVVREALVKENYDFEMDFGDIFQNFRAVHVKRPASLKPATMALLPDCFSYMQGISLPMPDDMVNISIGVPRHNLDKIPAELKSDDPKVVAKYVRENLKCFELDDYDDFATKWIGNGRWKRTSQVHCNTYHSTKANIIIMGDAAHATSPTIGMGMNTALRDSQKFYELLMAHKDNFEQALPAFSAERVREGNSLTDLAMNLYCLDANAQMLETFHMVIRSALNMWFPSLVSKHPQTMIGNPNVTLADVYTVSTKLGIVPKHREINNRIRQDCFERSVGMIPADYKKKGYGSLLLIAAVGVVGAAGFKYFM